MLSHLQKFLNLSDIMFLPVFDTILLSSPHSEKIILHVCIKLSALKLFTHFITGTFLWLSTMQRWWLFLMVKLSAVKISTTLMVFHVM